MIVDTAFTAFTVIATMQVPSTSVVSAAPVERDAMIVATLFCCGIAATGSADLVARIAAALAVCGALALEAANAVAVRTALAARPVDEAASI